MSSHYSNGFRLLFRPRGLAALLLTCTLGTTPALAQSFTRATTAFPAAGIVTPTASVAFGNGTFVSIGLKGRSATVPTANAISAYTSTDGNVWTERVINLPNVVLGNHGVVRFIGGQFIFTGRTLVTTTGVGTAYLARSADGISWTVTNPATGLPPASGFQEMVTGAGTTLGIFGTTLSASTDGGATWTERTAPGTIATAPYSDLTYGAGRFVLTATGTSTRVWTSPDASTWTEILAGQQNSGRIAFGNGIFVLTGTNYKTSTDGVAFTVRPTPANFNLTGTALVRFLGGRFISPTFGFNSSFQFGPDLVGSPDGLTWTRVAPYANDLLPFSPLDFAEGNNRLVAVGFQNSGTPLAPNVAAVVAVLDTTNLPVLPSAPVAPAITTPPVATAAVLGRSATLSVTATGPGLTYQWSKDGAVIAGATGATYTIASVIATSAGNYTVTVRNSVGAAPATAPVALTLVTAEKAGRLINLSVLTDIATPGSDFTIGYVVGGAATSGAKPLVIRAGGPSLSAFGITAFLDDPKLETFAGSTSTGSNDNWGGSNQLSAALVAVGAFAFNSPTSKDAATTAQILTRDNSVLVSSANNGTGAVIAEVYDATPAANFAVTTPRLLNVSVRKNLGTGVTAGFVLGGSTPTRVLIRVVGPGLAAFGVTGTVVDPQLTLFAGSTKIGENNDWAGTAELTAAATSVGAFALPAATSKDAALLVSLQPGNYSVFASGVNNTSGVALVEVYELP